MSRCWVGVRFLYQAACARGFLAHTQLQTMVSNTNGVVDSVQLCGVCRPSVPKVLFLNRTNGYCKLGDDTHHEHGQSACVLRVCLLCSPAQHTWRTWLPYFHKGWLFCSSPSLTCEFVCPIPRPAHQFFYKKPNTGARFTSPTRLLNGASCFMP